MKIFYSHHVWKYNTPIEDFEIECIKRDFSNCVCDCNDSVEVINPRNSIPQDIPESEIMSAAYNLIGECDAFVFSTLSGVIGHGVFNEILCALNNEIPVYQFDGNSCFLLDCSAHEFKNSYVKDFIFKGDNRIYALLYPSIEYVEE